MGIESGGRHQSPDRELSSKELGFIFAGQNHDSERVLKPQPEDLIRLAAADLHTFNLVLTARYFLILLERYHHQVDISLIGGLGVASATSRNGLVYRTSHDIDFLIPDDQIDYILDVAFGRDDFRKKPLAPNIYRMEVPVGLGVADRTFIPDPKMKVAIDLFAYHGSQGRNAVFDGGSYPNIDLGVRYPVRPQDRKLMGLPVKTAPKDVLLKMKKYDAQVRTKGRLDYERLQESR